MNAPYDFSSQYLRRKNGTFWKKSSKNSERRVRTALVRTENAKRFVLRVRYDMNVACGDWCAKKRCTPYESRSLHAKWVILQLTRVEL